MKLNQAEQQDIDCEIARVHGALTNQARRLSQSLGHDIWVANAPPPEKSTLVDMLQDLFAHARRERKHPDIAQVCQNICELLYVDPLAAVYEIPAHFWTSLTGQAVRACMGDRSGVAVGRYVSIRDAAALAECSRSRVHRAAADGDLPVARRIGNKRMFAVRDVLEWAGKA